MAIDIASILRRAADRYPGREALVFEDKRFTYAEWNERVNRFAFALYDLGICPGDRVAFYLTNSEGSVTTHFACQKLGAVSVPINFRLGRVELEQIVRDSGARVLVYSQFATEEVAAMARHLRSVHDFVSAADLDEQIPPGHHSYYRLMEEQSNHREPNHRNQAETISALIYTSGTTGRAKGVIHTHGNDFHIAMNCVMEYSLRRGDRALHIAPLYHVGGMQAFFIPHALVGGTNVVMGRYDCLKTMETIEREKITSLFAVPVQLEEMLDHPRRPDFDLSSLRLITTGGAASTSNTLRRVADELCPGVFNGYGMTEGSLTLLLHPEDLAERPESCGKPTLITDARVIRHQEGVPPNPEEVVPAGQKGQLVVRGPQVTPGYWNNTAATGEKLRLGWLHTGDVFSRDQDGFFYFHGRVDDMIVSGGENVYPREVEEAVLGHAGVSSVAVVGLPHQRWGQAVTAVVVARGPEVTAESVLEFCRQESGLARYKCPKMVLLVEELPRNPTGKIQRFRLVEQFREVYAEVTR